MTDQPEIPDHTTDATDDAEAHPDERADELDADRIHRIARLRQALGRSRSHAIALAVVTGVLAAQLLFNLARHLLAHGPTSRAALYAIAAIALVAITALAIRRARRISTDLRRPRNDPPTHHPDFSTLRDGSHRGHNLDRM